METMEPEAYAGRWVARLRGRIIAQGGTPGQARLAALSRYKETPEIVYMPTTDPLNLPPLLDEVLRYLPQDLPVYLVGGAVRDLLLNRESRDYDFALPGGGIQAARQVANGLEADFYPLDDVRDTGRVLVRAPAGAGIMLDFATFRGADLDADLLGRDFTINALALDLRTRQLFDPLGGALDLKNKQLRACSASSFEDDPVRVLRAVRFAAQLGMHILPETRPAMKKAAARLAQVSAERVRDELFHILEGPDPAACVRALDLLGVLAVILPELGAMKGVEQPAPHQQDVWEHTLSLLGHLEQVLGILAPGCEPESVDDLMNGMAAVQLGRYRRQVAEHLATQLVPRRALRGLLFLAALYHDAGKPDARQLDEGGRLHFWKHDRQGASMAADRARQLAFSQDEISRLEVVIANHMRLPFHASRLIVEGRLPTRRAIYRFFKAAGPAGVDLCLLALADMRATYQHTLPQAAWESMLEVVRIFLENWFEKPEESIQPPALLNGNDLMTELHLEPGPKIGELLEAIREAQATGDVTTRQQGLELARKKLA